MMSNIYVGMRKFKKYVIGPEVYEVEHFVLVNNDARLMPSSFAKSRYKTRVATDLAWGYAGASPLALAHSILWIELRDAENGYEIAYLGLTPFDPNAKSSNDDSELQDYNSALSELSAVNFSEDEP